MGSLGFMGLALGQWGNAVIEAYKTAMASSSSSMSDDGEAFAKKSNDQKCYSMDSSGRLYHHRSRKPISYGQERRRQRQRSLSLSLSLSRHSRDATATDDIESYFRSPCESDNEAKVDDHIQDDNDNSGYFVLFPRLPWLLVQSLVLTTLSMICVTSIRYYEQKQQSQHDDIRTNDIAGAATNTTTVNEVSFDNSDEWDFVSTLYYALSTATTTGMKDVVVPVSSDGTSFALLLLPLSAMTSLHWVVYIAQKYIQRMQRQRHKHKQRMLRRGKCQGPDNEHQGFDTNANEVIFVADGQKNHKRQNCVVKSEDDGSIPPTIVTSTPKIIESSSSLDEFYELELQRMGLVDIETFRVLKRSYALRQRQKLHETNKN